MTETEVDCGNVAGGTWGMPRRIARKSAADRPWGEANDRARVPGGVARARRQPPLRPLAAPAGAAVGPVAAGLGADRPLVLAPARGPAVPRRHHAGRPLSPRAPAGLDRPLCRRHPLRGGLRADRRPGWLAAPRFLPAWLFGLATVAFGWFLLQPGLGLGWAASKTPNPTKVRLLNLAGHTVFGLGLYLTALVIR